MNLKYYIYRLKYRYGKYFNLTVPVDVSLELSSFCDAHCTYCYHNDKKNLPFPQKHMSYDLAQKILYESADLGVASIKTNFRCIISFSIILPIYINLLKFRFGDMIVYNKLNCNFFFSNKISLI